MPLSLFLPANQVIITVAQTGAIVNKTMNPNVSEQPDDIAASALACYNEGAAIVHVHARDETGENTARIESFQAIHDKIRAVCPLILRDSTGGGPNLTQEERSNCLKAGPEMASLNMGTMMRISGKYAGVPWSNMPQEIEKPYGEGTGVSLVQRHGGGAGTPGAPQQGVSRFINKERAIHSWTNYSDWKTRWLWLRAARAA